MLWQDFNFQAWQRKIFDQVLKLFLPISSKKTTIDPDNARKRKTAKDCFEGARFGHSKIILGLGLDNISAIFVEEFHL